MKHPITDALEDADPGSPFNKRLYNHAKQLETCCRLLAEELRAKRAFGFNVPESPALRMWEGIQKVGK